MTTALASQLAPSAFACPRCRAVVSGDSAAYRCAACGSRYPIVLGIADFRLFPDPWIGLEEDRDKACRLESSSRGASLETMVRTYWAMTPGTPRSLADRFVEHVLGAHARSREWLSLLGDTAATGEWLDIGTGTGDLATAAGERGVAVVGVDVAMRWLVVARRRAELAGADVRVVCCNAEHLPFPDATFSRVVSIGTLEHCRDADMVLKESRRVLARRGQARVRTVNRYTLLREPHVGVWGVGLVPRRLADRYVRWRSGRRYEHHRPLSALELERGFHRAGFDKVHVEAAPLLLAERTRLGRLSWGASLYEGMRRVPLARSGLRWIAPLLEARGVTP